MKLLKAHHVQIIIPAGREDEAREFYTVCLGLREVSKPGVLRERGGFWLELEGFQIHVGLGREPVSAESREHIAYEVEDLDFWRKRLAKRSITCKEGLSIPGYRRMDFRDPFQNRIEFLERVD